MTTINNITVVAAPLRPPTDPRTMTVCYNQPVKLSVSGLVPGGGGIALDGTQSVDVLPGAGIDISNNFTVEFWIKPSELSPYFVYFDYSANLRPGMKLIQDGGNIRLIYAGNSLGEYSYTPQVNVWTHLAVVRQGYDFRIYADGMQLCSFTSSAGYLEQGADLTIGSVDHPIWDFFFKGSIDEFRFWNAAVTDQNRSDWMHREVDDTHPDYSNLKVYMKFNATNTLQSSVGNFTAQPHSGYTAVPSDYFIYTWTGPYAPAPSAGEVQITTAGLTTPATYSVVASGGSCTISDAVTINVVFLPAPQATVSGSACSGQPITLTASGPISGAINLNGTSQYIAVAHDVKLQTPGDFTYEMWVNPTSFSAYNTYFENGNLANYNGLLLRQDSPSTIGLYINNGTQNGYTASTINYVPPLGVWTHLALVRSSGTISLYANSTLVGNFTANTRQILSTDGLRIGSSAHATGQLFKGSIDEFHFWNVAITPADLRFWMYQGWLPTHPNIPNLKLMLRFETGNELVPVSFNLWPATVSAPNLFTAAVAELISYATFTWTGPNAPLPSANKVQTTTAGIMSPYPYIVYGTTANGCNTPPDTADAAGIASPVPAPVASAIWQMQDGQPIELTASGMVPGGGFIQLDGSTQSVNVTHAADLQMSRDFTYEMWVYPTSTGGKQTYFANGTDGWYSPKTILLRQESSKISCSINGETFQITYAPPQNSWTHLALIRSGSTISLYANANKIGDFTTTSNSTILPNSGLFIGRTDSPSNFFKGSIDEFRFWNNKSLTETELRNWMYIEVTPSHPSYSFLTVYLQFNVGRHLIDSKGAHTVTDQGGCLSLPANTYTYNWSGPNSPTATTNEISTSTAGVNLPAQYRVSCTDAAGCTSQQSVPVNIKAYANPGGLPAYNTLLWLCADKGVSGNGTITSWVDQGLKSHILNQATAASQPAINTTSKLINYNPSLTFDGTNDFMKCNEGILGTAQYNSLHVFTVKKNKLITTEVLFSEVCSPELISAHLPWNDGRIYFDAGGVTYNRSSVPWGSVNNIPNTWELGFEKISNTEVICRDGKNIFQANATTALPFIGTNQPFLLGTSGAANYSSMDLSEFFIYAGTISENERQRVQSYFAIKYGISLDQTTPTNYLASDGTLIWDATANAGYNYHITGIGLDRLSGLCQKQSRNSDSTANGNMLAVGLGEVLFSNMFSGYKFSSDKNFVLWGDNGAQGTRILNVYNGNVIIPQSCLSRTWKAGVTGDLNAVQLKFFLKDIANAASKDVFKLLISPSPDFDPAQCNPIEASAWDNNTGELTFDGVIFTDGNYFTVVVGSPGPGGLPLANTRLWLKADADIAANNNLVNQWKDQSQNGFIIEQNFANSQPTINASSSLMNYNPTIRFDGSDDYMKLDGGILGTAVYNNMQIFAVKVAHGIQNDHLFYENCIPDRLCAHMPWNDANIYYDAGDGNPATNRGYCNWGGTIDVPYIWELGFSNSSKEKSIFRNGVRIGYNNSNSTIAFQGQGNSFYLGTSAGNTGYSKMDLAELIMYSGTLSDNERLRIQSYLSLKYGVSLDQTTPTNYLAGNGVVIWDAAANSAYNFNVTGIGRDDANKLYQKQSRNSNAAVSGNMIAIGLGSIETDNISNSGEFYDDLNFMIWGDNGAATNLVAANLPPELVTTSMRLSRQWKVSVTGYDYPVQMKFFLTGIVDPAITGDLVLLIDDDGNFTNGGTREISLTSWDINTNEAIFDYVGLENGAYFTLAVLPKSPGGVPMADIKLWLKANDGLIKNGVLANGVTEWSDRSGKGNGLTSSVNPAYRPSNFSDKLINYNPTVSFDGSNDYLYKSGGILGNSTYTGTEVFAVNSSKKIKEQYVFSEACNTQSYSLALPCANNGAYYSLGNANTQIYAPDWEGTLGTPYIWNCESSTTQSGSFSINKNGMMLPTSAGSAAQNVTGNGSPLYIGSDANGSYAEMDLSELIIFTGTLMANEKQRMQSYLALKYGISLDQQIPTDYLASNGSVIWKASDNGNFNNHITGIGRDDVSTLYQKQSCNSDASNFGSMVAIGLGALQASNALNSNSIVANSSFLLWADNGLNGTTGIQYYRNNNRVEGTRLKRVWKVSSTGGMNALQMKFFLKDIMPDVNSENFRLIIGDDENFDPQTNRVVDFAAINKTDLTVTFDNIYLNNGEYFTLVVGYTGPGGLPLADMNLWLKTDGGEFGYSFNFNNVWADKSGKGNNMGRSIANWNTPTEYPDRSINYNPTVSFDGYNDYLFRTGGILGTSTYTNAHVFSVNTIERTDNSFLFDENLPSGFFRCEMPWANSISWWANNTNATNITWNLINPSQKPDIWHLGSESLNQGVIDRNGKNLSSVNTSIISFTGANNNFYLGANSGGNYMKTNLSELMIYTGTLSDNERQRVQSYLAIKYGISLDQTTPTNYLASDGSVIWDASQNTDYNNSITGIGRDDGGMLNQKQSRNSETADNGNIVAIGVGLIAPNNASNYCSFKKNLSFLLWGDNGLSGTQTTELPPALSLKTRLKREWNVRVTGTGERVELKFFVRDLVNNATTADFKLMIDDDGDFSNGNTSVIAAGVWNDNTKEVTFNNVTFTDGQYFTLILPQKIRTSTLAAADEGVLCTGGTLELYALVDNAVSWSWTGPNGFSSTRQNPVIENVTTANSGLYHVAATTPAGIENDDVDVEVIEPAAPVINSSSRICNGGTLQLNAASVAVPGNGQIALNGISQYVVTPNLRDHFPTKDLTLELWFKPSSAGVVIAEGGTQNPTLCSSQLTILESGELLAHFGSLGTVSLGIVAWETWNHVALCYNASTTEFKGVLNGISSEEVVTGVKQMPWEINNGNDLVYALGAGWDADKNSVTYFKGEIDEFRVWNACLSEAELEDWMYDEVDASHPRYNSLCAYYKFNSGFELVDTKGGHSALIPNNFTVAPTIGERYTWYGPDDFYADIKDPQIGGFSTVKEGTYSVAVTDESGCKSQPATVTVMMNALSTPLLSIAANTAWPVCQGASVSFTATPVFGGAAPVYQWLLNGNSIGNNSSTFVSTTLANNDVVSCTMVSNASCLNTATATSNAITISVFIYPPPFVSDNSPVCEGGLLNMQANAPNNGAISLNGTSQYITVEQTVDLQTPGNFTYEMWVNPTNFSAFNTYFENGNLANYNGLLLRQDSPATMGLYINNGTQSGYTTSTLSYAPPTGRWTHLALVRSGSTLSLYANSTLVGNFTNNTRQILSTDGLRIGSSAHTGGQLFNGSIDEFRFWKAAVNPANLAAWMNKEVTSAHPDYANLKAYFKFNNGALLTDSKDNHTVTNYGCMGVNESFPACSYFWSGPNGYTSSLQNPAITGLTTNQAGMYFVYYTTIDGCRSQATYRDIALAPALPPPTFTSNSPVCEGGRLNLQAIAPNSGAISLDGTSQYIAVEQAVDLQTPGNFTYEMWVNPSSFTQYNTYFENGNLNNYNGLLLRQDSPTAMYLYINDGTQSGYVASLLAYAPPIGVWTHLALVRSSGTITLYVNGNFQGNFAANSRPILSTDGLRIGSPTHTGGQFFKGSIDEFRFWNVAINPANHAAWMNKELTSAHPEYANLIAYFKFNNGALLTDSKGNHIATNYGCMSVNESFPAYSYFWSGPNGFTSSLQNPAITGLTTNQAGMYFVNYTAGNGCRSQATYRDIVLAPAPSPPTFTTNSPVCEGGLLNLQAIAPNNGAISLDGTSQYIAVAQAVDLQTPGNFTYEIWVNPSSFSQYNTYFENGNINNYNGLLLRQDSPTAMYLYIGNGAPNSFTYSAINYAPPLGVWTHLALVRSSGNISLSLLSDKNTEYYFANRNK
ncbi:MAG: LamG-like jellyroll fold domain-containing protein, partial [Bacteroidota bacterium]